MTNYNFYKVDIPGGPGADGFTYISVDGVDPTGLAVGNFGDTDGDWHGFTVAKNGSVTQNDPPTSSNNTDIVGIMDSGEIYGDFTDWENRQHGFTEIGGVFTTIDVPFATATNFSGATATGELFGSYVSDEDFVAGFTDNNGTFTTIYDPISFSTSVTGVNASGVIVGAITDAQYGGQAFVDIGGTFTTLNPPGSYSSSAVGVTDSGEVVGDYQDTANNQYGFTYDNGTYTTIAGPGSTDTIVSYVSPTGEIVGYYVGTDGAVHGFVDQGGNFTTVDVPDSLDTEISGINAAGDIYGDYNDASGQHGFIGFPGPSITAPNISATHGETFAASSMFSVSDPDGGTITQYVLWDTGSGGSEILVNGVAQPTQQNIDLTPSQLAQTTYQSGSGPDVFWVEAYDGAAWSSWTSLTVTAPVDNGPVATVSNLASTRGETFAGSSLFTYSDPFGDAATEYDVWNTGAGGGEFQLNGTPLSANQDNYITPAQLSQLTYVAGSSADTLWVRANDGTVWGAWSQAFTVKTPQPMLSVSGDATAVNGQTLSLSKLATIADPGNSGYQMLELWDSNGTVGGGQFVVNSMAQTGGHEIDVAPANVASTVFDVGTSAGTDTLWARLLQDDGTLTTWQPFNVTVPTPTLDVTSISNAMQGHAINLSSLVTVADPGNVGYQTLQLWDSDGTPAGGEFLINGVAQSGGHTINVPSGANVVFDAGTSAGTDTLWAQLIQDNGTAGGWDEFTVTVPTPTIGVSSIANAKSGEAINLSSLVTVADPGNVGYQTLQLWDSNGTPAGGEFLINGVAQSGGHTINVPSGANVAFDAGTSAGTDTLWAQLIQDNGTAGGWEEFTVTVPTPTIGVSSIANAKSGEAINLSSLVTVADPGNVGYQTLELWDSDGTAAGGEFLINGVAQSGGHTIDVPSGANVVFDAGTSAGTDTLWAQLIQDNGTLTAWQPFTVTVPNPSLAVQDYTTATPGQTIQLSDLVTISDPGNVGYQKLELWDSDGTAATGQFMVGGMPQTGGHEIDVTPANVANTVFDEGTTGNTDTLWAQLMLNNGTTTGWQQFTVVDPVTVAQGATLELANPYAGHAIFAANSGTLQLDQSTDFSGTVAGMTGADTLDLRDVGFGANTSLGYTANATNTGGSLSVGDGTHLAQIALLGQYAASNFVTASDGHGGTLVEMQSPSTALLAPTQHA